MMFYDSFSWFVLSKLFIVLVAAEVSCFYPVPPVEQDHWGASRLAGTRCTWCMLPRFLSSWIRVAPRMRSSRRYKTPLGAADKSCVQATSWRPFCSGNLQKYENMWWSVDDETHETVLRAHLVLFRSADHPKTPEAHCQSHNNGQA